MHNIKIAHKQENNPNAMAIMYIRDLRRIQNIVKWGEGNSPPFIIFYDFWLSLMVMRSVEFLSRAIMESELHFNKCTLNYTLKEKECHTFQICN